MFLRLAVMVCLAFSTVSSGCGPRRGDPAPAAAASGKAKLATAAVAKVVFIDQENGCPCTRGRIEGSWTALMAALAGRAEIPFERIHSDTQRALAERYTAQRPLTATPGIYFVNSAAIVVEMLQGEVRTDQIAAVLK
jgi:hypothetical protein